MSYAPRRAGKGTTTNMRPNHSTMRGPAKAPRDEADAARIEEIEKTIGRKLSGDVKIARLRPKRGDEQDGK